MGPDVLAGGNDVLYAALILEWLGIATFVNKCSGNRYLRGYGPIEGRGKVGEESLNQTDIKYTFVAPFVLLNSPS